MIQRQRDTGAVLRLVIIAVLLLCSLSALRAIAATSSSLAAAIRAQRSRLEMAPRDVVALNDLANLLVLANDVEEAEEVYLLALEIDPERVTAVYNLALLHVETGRRKLASQGFQRAIEIDPGHAWSHYQLGTLTAAAGNRNKAIDHYVKAFRLEPRLAQADFNPHVIDNSLVIDAVLRAHAANTAANPVPRLYRNPERVKKLLLPPESPPAAHQPERAEPETHTAGPQSGVSPQGGVRGRQAPSERIIRQPVATVPSEVPAGSGEAAAGADVVRPEPATPPSALQPPPPQPPRQPPPQPPRLPEVAPGAPKLEPGFSSSARLELRLVPKPQDRLAASAGSPR